MSKKKTNFLKTPLGKITGFYNLLDYFLSIAVVATAVILPLFFGPKGYVNITETKNSVFYAIAFFILITALIITITIFFKRKNLTSEVRLSSPLKWDDEKFKFDSIFIGYPLLILFFSFLASFPSFIVIAASAFQITFSDNTVNSLMSAQAVLLIVVKVFVVILSLGAAFASVYSFKKLREIGKNQKYTALYADLAILFYLTITCISSLFSNFQEHVYFGYDGRNNGLIVTCLYILIYFIISRFYKFKKWHALIFVIISCFVSLFAITQFFGLDLLGIETLGNVDLTTKLHFAKRMLSTIGNLNFMSWYVSMMFGLTAGLFVLWKTKFNLWLLLPLAMHSCALYYIDADSGAIAVACIFFMVLLFAVQRKEYLAKFFIVLTVYFGFGFAGTSFFAYYYQNFSRINDWNRYLILTVACALLAAAVKYIPVKIPIPSAKRPYILGGTVFACGFLALAVLYLLPPNTFTGFLDELTKILHGQVDNSFGTYRVYIWKRAISIFIESPKNIFLGTGQDSFGAEFMQRFTEETADVYGVVTHVDQAHNIYLQILVCSGIFGFLAFMAFMFGIFAKGFKKGLNSPFAAALLIAIVSYSVQGTFIFALPFVTPFFWVMAAMLISHCREQNEVINHGGKKQ